MEVIFVAAGFVAADRYWDKFERAWRTQLDESKIKYYKTSEWRNLNGQFTGIDRQSADHARAELEKLIFANRIIAFTLGVIMRDYKKVRSESSAAKFFYEDDPKR